MPITDEYIPNIVALDQPLGASLVESKFQGFTPDEFGKLANSETALGEVVSRAAVAKALGVQEHGFLTLMRSSVRDLSQQVNQQRIDQQSIILPYIQRRQPTILNANYFDLVSSADNTDPGLPANAADFTIGLGSSPFKSPLKNIERYFLKGMSLIILTWDNNSDRNAKVLNYRIIESVNANAGATEQAKVTAVPMGKTVPSRPTFGVVQIGANNVSDWEYWCQNQPVNNNMGFIVNWLQRTRRSYVVSDRYREILSMILEGKLNPWDQNFKYLPLVEQNRQQEQAFQLSELRTMFYNDYASAAQSPETYQQLEPVEDPELPGSTIEFKANAPGIYNILAENQRVLDLNGAAIDFDVLAEQLYTLARNRGTDGGMVNVIDSFTDRFTFSLLFELMAKYYPARYGTDLRVHAQVGQTLQLNGMLNFKYNLYDLPDQGIQWAVFHDPFFDDLLSAFNSTAAGGSVGAADDFKNRGRQIMFLDWGDIAKGVADARSVVRRSPDPTTSELYKCRIASNQTEYSLSSELYTVMLDRPHRHLILQNFNLVPPTTAGGFGASVPNP